MRGHSPRKQAYPNRKSTEQLKNCKKRAWLKKSYPPHQSISTPIQLGLQILMNQKVEQCKCVQRKIKTFLRKKQTCSIETPNKREHKLVVIEGKNRLMQTIKLEHNNAQKSVDIISTLQRWSQILDSCLESYLKALDRKVHYQVVIEKPLGKISFSERIQSLLSKPNFELKLSEAPLTNNVAIFDDNEATINFFQGKPLGQSPIIWTNHPGLIQMCRDHFGNVWKSSREYKIQKEDSDEPLSE
jgi:sugar-specific transcriptional regulator TrmB